MSSPIKLDAKLSELKMADVRLLVYGTLCNDGKIDFEKLAALAGMKKTSAHTNYWRAKKHLEQIVDGNSLSPTKTARSKPEDGDAGASKKSRSGGKRGAAKDASTKKAEPAKRRKTDTKTVSELVDSTQAEDTAETTPADTTDQTE
ncbi:hypothetical protein N7449_000786 [Penicillium cf. viridicatum]|uniref:Uncharacterized protein n=1 Tax=Penicillium cf. viridicatum TaxID=2972119 RepID=A0A9W9T8M7_9EURO|nr:hypothetical protein N7449_000786 [Penicillium cf. viridicatum]